MTFIPFLKVNDKSAAIKQEKANLFADILPKIATNKQTQILACLKPLRTPILVF
jgi:hypothetical protein